MKRISILLLILVFTALITKANNYTVTTAADTSVGSLRVMIDSANANPGLDTITLNLTVQDTIYLGSRLPVITDSLVITGLPCQNPTISGNSGGFNHSAFSVSDSTTQLTLNYLNIFNCSTSGVNANGAVYGGQLYINYCYFYGNSYTQNSGNAAAGAVCAQSVWVYNSTFNNDSCAAFQQGGGALYAENVYLSNCTFIGNYSADYGGAINGNFIEIQNCTFTANYAGTGGGAIFSNYPSTGTLIANSIIWGNTIGVATGVHYAGIEFLNADSSGGCNILQDTATVDSFKTTSSDIIGVNPQFGTFGYYSGCVPVLPILCGSVAQNHAGCTGATATDAEGIAAVGIRDAGAFEITYPHLYSDSLDSIEPGTTADLYEYFNTTGLTIQWPDTINDSTAASVDTGTYTVIGTNFLGCSDTATITIIYAVDTTSGIKNVSAINGIQLYPNPAKDWVTVTWGDKTSPTLTLKVTDMLGRTVFTQNVNGATGKFNIPIASFSSGAYYVGLIGASQNIQAAKLVVLER